jgi:hypothetical protein
MGEVARATENRPVLSDMAQSAMQKAIETGNLEIVDKAFEWARQLEQEAARRAYHKDFALFFSACPSIPKSSRVAFDSRRGGAATDYPYADLAAILDTIRPVLGKHGFSVDWETRQDDNKVTVTCNLTHNMGFSKSSTLSAPPDTSGNKNAIQAIKSTITYLKRATVELLTGVSTHGEDDDGRGAYAPGLISSDQESMLLAKIDETGKNLKTFCRAFKIENVADLPAHDFDRAWKVVNTGGAS